MDRTSLLLKAVYEVDVGIDVLLVARVDFVLLFGVMMTFNSIPSFPRELDRVFRITDGIMRSLIVCKGE